MATELAAAHPAETWQLVGGGAAAIVALSGIIYNRLNKDIEDSDKRQSEYQQQTDKRINDQAREIEGVTTEVKTLIKQVEEIFKKLSNGAESFSKMREDLRELETRLDGIMRELEQKSSTHQEIMNDLKQQAKELKNMIDLVERRCIARHPGAVQ